MQNKLQKLFGKSKTKSVKTNTPTNQQSSAEVKVYIEKIKQKLDDPDVAKKAAMIIEAMLTGKKIKKIPTKKKLLKTK